MLINESERSIQLELNRNYLKSFPARLKFCHVVSVFGLATECLRARTENIASDNQFELIDFYCLHSVFGKLNIWIIVIFHHRRLFYVNYYSDRHSINTCFMFIDIFGNIDDDLESRWKDSNGAN